MDSVKASANIFTRECQEYWVFSLDGAATHNNSITDEQDQLIENKLNLEKLGYGNLRNYNGQIIKVQRDTGSQGTNNKTHKEVITLESIRENFYLGIGDALIGAVKGVFEFVSHPIDGVIGVANGIQFLNKVISNPNCEEAIILDKIIVEAVNNFIDSNLNEKSRVLGRIVGEILIIVATDGIAESIMEHLPQIANQVKNGGKVEKY